MREDRDLLAEEYRDHLKRLEKLLELSHKIHGTLELDKALEIVLDAALELTGMQRGFIMLYNEENELDFRKGRDFTGATLGVDQFQVSWTLIQKAIDRGSLYYFINTPKEASESVMNLRIGSGLCVPLFAYRVLGDAGSRKLIGVLYADSQNVGRFRKAEEEIASALALHAALALENATLYELATLDGLTRIYQRRYFDTVARMEWKRSVRHNRPFSILMIDIDHFKKINDTYGHAQGDLVLRKIAKFLKASSRQEDIVARYGGEEFILLLPETDINGARYAAGRILEKIPSQVRVQDKIPVTVSIGVASYPFCNISSVEQLVKLSDVALYKAKEAGRNCVRICKSIR